MRIDVTRYEPHTLSLRRFKLFFQNKKHKQTLDSAQYGLEIIFKSREQVYLKQIIQIEHNVVKNPKCGRGFELGATVKQIRRDSNLESDEQITRLRCLHYNINKDNAIIR